MNKQKVLFVTSAHKSFDDRIYYHMAHSLQRNGHLVQISSSTEELEHKENNIHIKSFDGNSISKKEKLHRFTQLMDAFSPQVIVSSEPLPLLAASRYKKKQKGQVRILFDVTEWYPSKKNLEHLKGVSKWLKAFQLAFFNVYCAAKADGFIFGEHYKQFPYKQLFWWKRKIIVTYFPDLNYIPLNPPKEKIEQFCLGYTGKFTEEKGIYNFLQMVEKVKQKRPDIPLKIKLIGYSPDEDEQKRIEKKLDEIQGSIEILRLPLQQFTALPQVLEEIDLFFDLRKIDFENTHCLPIKLFYYAACGKPVIYSKLMAIRKEVKTDSFGFLVMPEDSQAIAELVINYFDDVELYQSHCKNARKMAEKHYNWRKIEQSFIDFIEQ